MSDNAMPTPAGGGPFLSQIMQIEPQWIDYNGHLNMAYYNVMFDRAIDQMWAELGIGPAYMKDRQGSTFTAECHVRYLREIHLGDPVRIAVWLIAAEGWISATSENMSVHIDMTRRKVAPFPADIQDNIGRVLQAHAALPRPEGLGRAIGMPKK